MALSCDEAPSLASGIVVTFGPDRLVLISQPASPGTATCSATTHPATHPPGDMSGRRLRAVGADSGITDGTAYLRFRRYLKDAGLPLSGLHVLRHSAAKLRRDAGAETSGSRMPAW